MRDHRTIWLTVAGMLVAGVCGCARLSGSTQIRPTVIAGAETVPENLELYNDLITALHAGERPETVAARALKVVSTGSPGLIAYATIQIENWSDSYEDESVLRTVAHACLERPDPLVRWSGVHAAYHLGDKTRVLAALLADYPSLAIRPDYPKGEVVGATGFIGQVSPAVALASLRCDLVGLLGELQIKASLPVVEAITADHDEWHEETRKVARQTVNALSG